MVLKIKNFLNSKIAEDSAVRLLYHRIVAIIAALWFAFPAKRLNVVLVTGTKGKTTSCNLIASVLQEAGKKVAMATTINFQIGDLKWANLSKRTTLSPFELQSFLQKSVEANCEYAVIETSSHAITQSRIWGLNYDSVCLTQIDEDHLEYHGTKEAYISAKEKIFKTINGLKRKPNISKIIILNQDDDYFDRFNEYDADLKMTYGINRGTVYADNIELDADSSKFTIGIPNHHIDIQWRFTGTFNIANALLAASYAIANGINLTVIKSALEKTLPLPGRQEKIEVGQPYNVIVDYAHTVSSLEKLCSLYKPMTEGKLILVFGCTGGGRDKSKRSLMGEVADKYADLIILTNDDPYFEDEMDILDNIASGIDRKEGEGLWKIVSRKEAIHLALMMAQTGDTVLIAGKGCEEIQIIGSDKIPWDDRKVVQEFLSRVVEIEIDTGEFVSGNACLDG